MPLPSAQYAFLSQKIYEPISVGSKLSSNTHEFRVRYVSPPSATNYRGMVVQDNATKQLIVVNKGTDPTSVHDLIADLGMGMMGAPTQWPEAARTMRWALEHAEQTHIPKGDISITGHSLGGALAQLQASLPEAAGVHTETFNAFGARAMAEALSRTQAMDVASGKSRIVNHRMIHDPVSKFAGHIGDEKFYMDQSDYPRHKEGSLFPIGEAVAIAASHGIDNFWDKERNQPAAIFAHNYMDEFERGKMEEVPRGVPMDLSIPWNVLGADARSPASPSPWNAPETREPDVRPGPDRLDVDKQALYSALQHRVPDAGPTRLMQFTAACHENGITAANLDRVHLNQESMTIEFHGRSWLATPAVIDLTRQAPEPGQSMAHIRNVDQQQMEMAQQIAQSAQLSQQGPVR